MKDSDIHVAVFHIPGLAKITFRRAHENRDKRGTSFESFDYEYLHQRFAAQNWNFNEDYEVLSHKRTIRGFHYQVEPYEQAKYVRVLRGHMTSVVIDLRIQSRFFLWPCYVNLTTNPLCALYIPAGCAHATYAHTSTHVLYKFTKPYEPDAYKILRYDDPQLDIRWPVSPEAMLISDADRAGETLAELASRGWLFT